MRKRVILAAVAVMASAVFVPAPQLAYAQAAVNLMAVDVVAVAGGYRTSKLIGTSVTNDQNQKIGSINDIIIGRDRVLFAVLQVGGFLGLGGHLVAVPYQTLVVDDAGKKIVLPGATKDALEKLAEFKYPT